MRARAASLLFPRPTERAPHLRHSHSLSHRPRCPAMRMLSRAPRHRSFPADSRLDAARSLSLRRNSARHHRAAWAGNMARCSSPVVPPAFRPSFFSRRPQRFLAEKNFAGRLPSGRNPHVTAKPIARFESIGLCRVLLGNSRSGRPRDLKDFHWKCRYFLWKSSRRQKAVERFSSGLTGRSLT